MRPSTTSSPCRRSMQSSCVRVCESEWNANGNGDIWTCMQLLPHHPAVGAALMVLSFTRIECNAAQFSASWFGWPLSRGTHIRMLFAREHDGRATWNQMNENEMHANRHTATFSVSIQFTIPTRRRVTKIHLHRTEKWIITFHSSTARKRGKVMGKTSCSQAVWRLWRVLEFFVIVCQPHHMHKCR